MSCTIINEASPFRHTTPTPAAVHLSTTGRRLTLLCAGHSQARREPPPQSPGASTSSRPPPGLGAAGKGASKGSVVSLTRRCASSHSSPLFWRDGTPYTTLFRRPAPTVQLCRLGWPHYTKCEQQGM